MTEYKTCKAFEEGYAQKIPFINGDVIICDTTCKKGYRKTLHVDAEPKHICMVDGMIPIKTLRETSRKSLDRKVQETPKISIAIR